MTAAPGAAGADRPTHLQIAAWAALLALTAAYYLHRYDWFQFGVYRDDQYYAVIARSVAHPDRDWLLGASWMPSLARPTFPVGYPLMLAPIVWLAPDSLEALKLPSLLAALTNGGLLFWGWRRLNRRRSYWWALGLAAVWGFTLDSLRLAQSVMAEPLFTTWWLAAMLVAERALQPAPPRGLGVGIGVVLAATGLTRSAGWILAGAAVAYLFIGLRQRAWAPLLRVLAGATIVIGLLLALAPAAWQGLVPARYVTSVVQYTSGLTARHAPPGIPYYTRLARAARLRVTTTFREVVVPLGPDDSERVIADRHGVGRAVSGLGLAVTGLMILGFIRWFAQEGIRLFQLSAVVYLAALMMWAWRETRLLYPIMPQLFMAFLFGLEAALSWAARRLLGPGAQARFVRSAVGATVLGLAANQLPQGFLVTDTRLLTGDMQARTTWLRANTQASDIVLTEEPLMDYLYSGRKTVPYPTAIASLGALSDYLDSFGVDYILMAPSTEWQIDFRPTYSVQTNRVLAVIADPQLAGRIQLVYESPSEAIEVFRVLR